MIEALTCWVREQLPGGTEDVNAIRLEPLSGDAGFRSYFRVLGAEPPMMAVHAPPATEKNQAFIDIAARLREAGVRAPEVFCADLQRGFLLLEDLGQEHLLDALTPDTADHFYGQAFAVLHKMQRIPLADSSLLPYSEALLLQEMALFPQWFVAELLAYESSEQEQAMLSALFSRLAGAVLKQPQVFVHRDFHARNLLVGASAPGVIDFQDAVAGPLTYDLVSLLRDCYIFWDPDRLEHWLQLFYQQMDDALKQQAGDFATFRQGFDLMGLQRHIKVLGIFARLYLRDGKPGYLGDLPLVIHYVLTVASAYPQYCAEFTHWFHQQLMPRINEQQWYVAFDGTDGWKRQ